MSLAPSRIRVANKNVITRARTNVSIEESAAYVRR